MALSSTKRGVEVYFGTMTIGWAQASSPVGADVAQEFVDMYAKAVHPSPIRLDSARVYAAGKTELILGKILPAAQAAAPGPILIDTKANPREPFGLSARGLREQLESSLKAMGVASVDLFYLHQPDVDVPLTESLAALHELVQQVGVISL
jgi:aryl-alcohol dehydrogenase-like predicted oxidoreductase